MSKTSIEELNKKYTGSFRTLKQSEIDFLENKLNNDDNEWYAPYAIQSIDNVDTNILCRYDTAGKYEDEVLVAIKPEWNF